MCDEERDIMEQFLASIKKLERIVETGVDKLDSQIGGGLRRGCLYLVAGRPTMGKTTLALEICSGIMNHYENKTVFCSLEMSASQVMEKIRCSQTEESLKKLETASEKLKSQDTSLDDAIKNYEEGLKHYKECSRILEEAKQKVEVLTK